MGGAGIVGPDPGPVRDRGGAGLADAVRARPRLLDLFCGAGGAAGPADRSSGYAKYFDCVGVDIVDQPRYPFEFHRGDALAFLRSAIACDELVGRYDAIHASPPCQAYSVATVYRDRHPDLVETVRDLLVATGLPYVIENVPGSPLRTGFVLCGSMFGLRVRRHRCFESNVLIMQPQCNHAAQGTPLGVYGNGGPGKSTRPSGGGGTKAARRDYGALMGIPWGTPAEIVQAIPPAYSEWIGAQLVRAVTQ